MAARARRPKSSGSHSWARCRCTSTSAPPPTPAIPLSCRSPTARTPRSTRTSPAGYGSSFRPPSAEAARRRASWCANRSADLQARIHDHERTWRSALRELTLPPAPRSFSRLRLADHAVHADHRAGDQLERQEATLLDPAGELDVEGEVAAEAELVVILRIADQ